MAMASSQKKQQQTLSNFFSRAPTRKEKSPPARAISPSVDDDVVLPPPKRRKISDDADSRITTPPPVEADNDEQQPITTLRPATANARPSKSLPVRSPAADRTSKYLFKSSPLQENIEPGEEEDGSIRTQKEALHRRFVKKLGKPDSIADLKRRNRLLNGEDDEAADGNEEEDEEEEEAAKPVKGKAATKKGASKLTPMEKQIVDIKRTNTDSLLVVEVGYKYRFFGEDARIAAKELNIMCIPGKYRYDEHPSEAHLDRFASASFPTHRLHVHVKRLVSAGHKVGVVRQLETAALKAVGDNRNTPFVRKLTNLYTKGTYIDDLEGIEEESGTPPPQSPSTGFLLCMTEVNAKGSGNDEKVHAGILAVQPSTGEIVYDNFEDGFMRSEIETRLLHIAPCEFLIVGDLSKATDRLVMHLAGSKSNVFQDKARIERVNKHKTTAAESHSHVTTFYANKMKATGADEKGSRILDKILGLPEHVTVCLSAMITHLSAYGLEHVFDLTKYFQPFSARSHMLINGNTLNSLEIYQNSTEHTTHGSLFWALDRTITKFGSRMLRKWVGRPLLDVESIEARQAAIEELLETDKAILVDKLRRVLARLRTDLEKSLIRIYYGKCTRSELLTVLQALQYLGSEFAYIADGKTTGFESPLVSDSLASLPTILPDVTSYLERINLSAAKANDKYAFLREEHETDLISEHKHGIASVEHDLDAFRSEAGSILSRKTPVAYITIQQNEYLIEVDNASPSIKHVPASWVKVNGTKKVSRFHPPEVTKLLRERDQHKESLAAACDFAYDALLADISTKYQLFRDTIQSLATLDCLLSLSTIASQPGYIRPTFTHSPSAQINLSAARHPMIEQLLLSPYVPNPISLSTPATRALLVTGPNMGGKSSYVRSVALLCIMAQIGSFIPCESAQLSVLDAVFTRMGAEDNMMAGESTFMVELSETSDILKMATERSLVILDELGRGTSTFDGMAIASSVLDFLVRDKKCLTLFITHYQSLARMANSFPDGELKNVHMKFSTDTDTDDTGDGDQGEKGEEKIMFLYEVGEGVAHRSYGLNVARLANVSRTVIGLAGQKSEEMEVSMRGRRVGGVGRLLMGHTSGMGEEKEGEGDMGRVLERLVEGIEEL